MKKIFRLCTLVVMSLLVMEVSAQTQVTLAGVVVSAEDNMPIVGATVNVVGTTRGTITSIDGDYSIAVQPNEVVEFSYIGLESYQVAILPSMKVLNVTLKPSSEMIDDVVVVAYGVKKKGTVAGSVGSIDGAGIESVPAASFDQALQGQVAGLSVLSSSGDPSASATFQIRGTNSINSGTSPLFILDGAPISESDFNTISPGDIANVSVLKDASSTSIYGARAANGVVIITTKRGKMSDKPTIVFRSQFGISQMAYGNWDMMTTEERIQYEIELGMDDGQDYDALSQIDTNWIEEVFNDNAIMQSYDVSVSGASEKFNYYVSGNYFDQEGIAYMSYFSRMGIRANFEAKAADWMKIGSNTMFSYENYAEASEGEYTLVTPISAARFMLPYYSPYNEDGSLASINDGTWVGYNENPLEYTQNNPLEREKFRLMIQPFVEITPIKNLVIRSQFGYDLLQGLTSAESYPSYTPNNDSGYAGRSFVAYQTLSVTNTVNYSYDVDDKNSLNFLLGQEGVDFYADSFSVATYGQTNDALTSVSTGTAASSWTDSEYSYGYLSFFGRAEYSHDNRYYADLSLRGDASSRFAEGNRWGMFWSTGLLWNARNESFMAGNNWLTTAQVAFSAGTSGNSSIGNYEHLALVSGGVDYVEMPGVYPSSKGNSELTWEKLFTTNLSLRMGFFNRASLEIDLYNKKTTDMLMAVPVNYSTSSVGGYEWQNMGAMVNRGIEISASGTVIATPKFRWSLFANVSYNKNKITELYNGVQSYEYGETFNMMVVGESLGSFYINEYAGVNPINGDALWYTADGDITNELKDEDKVLLDKSYIAPWQGGFGTSVGWKNLSMDVQFSWVADRWVMNNDRYFDESNGRFVSYNQSSALLDRWQEPGDITDIPRHGVYTEFDSRLLEDASFLRLKNLTINWDLPSSVLKTTGFISAARIYVQGHNLLTFTEFTGLDPEGVSNMYQAAYPMSRQYTLGLNLTF
ncbi:MAG: TonB-dependent receptor [Rikenellaceae bacterium]